MSPSRRKPPWEMDIVDVMEDRQEVPRTEEEWDEINEIVEAQKEKPDPNYRLEPERIVNLDKSKYTKNQAYTRFAEIAASQGLVILSYREFPRSYTWECLYERKTTNKEDKQNGE